LCQVCPSASGTLLTVSPNAQTDRPQRRALPPPSRPMMSFACVTMPIPGLQRRESPACCRRRECQGIEPCSRLDWCRRPLDRRYRWTAEGTMRRTPSLPGLGRALCGKPNEFDGLSGKCTGLTRPFALRPSRPPEAEMFLIPTSSPSWMGVRRSPRRVDRPGMMKARASTFNPSVS
jgi:hypothetical protein